MMAVELGISPPDLLATPPAVFAEMLRYCDELRRKAERDRRR